MATLRIRLGWAVMLCVFAVSLCLGAPASAQQLLRVNEGGTSEELHGIEVRGLGDVDGDGIGDYVVGSEGRNDFPPSQVRLYSGATGTTIRETTGLRNQGFGRSLSDIGDLDDDGVDDYLVGRHLLSRGTASGDVRAFSGATGLLIRTYVPSGVVRFGEIIVRISDVDLDGYDDFVALASGNGLALVMSARTGIVITSVTAGSNDSSNPPSLAAVGDLDGDGFLDFAASDPSFDQDSGRVFVYSGASGSLIRQLSAPGGEGSLFGTRVAGLPGAASGGRSAIAISAPTQSSAQGGRSQGEIYVFDATTSQVLGSFPNPVDLPGTFARQMISIPDLNMDGVDELLVPGQSTTDLMAIDGRLLTTMFQSGDFSRFSVGAMDSIGDIDGDGIPEVLAGYEFEETITVTGGAVRVVSPRIFASVSSSGSGCSGGPFPIEIGISRPLIGTFATLVCRDAPLGAVGVLALGPLTDTAFSFGTPECSIPLNLAATLVAPVPSGTNWQMLVEIPSIPTLIGQELGLQCLYAPTLGPFGIDLSNVLRIRFGDR